MDSQKDVKSKKKKMESKLSVKKISASGKGVQKRRKGKMAELEKECTNYSTPKAGGREFKSTKIISRVLKINQYTVKRQTKTKMKG